MNTKNDWKLLTLPFTKELDEALQQQHYAAQFIALAGRYLIPQKADDSNTNMEFIPERELMLGNALPDGLRVALHLTDLNISILDQDNNSKKQISLEGKTKQEVFDELKQSLSELGVEVSGFKNELHYKIPPHPLEKGAVFTIRNEGDFTENANYRRNAKIVLNEIGEGFTQQEPIRVWPHHFDTGAFYVISKNEKGDASQTIGIGFAIPDTMVNEPYYYLSFWSEKPINDIDKLPALTAGHWMMPNWNGAILKHSEIIRNNSASGQHEMVKSFYLSGIKMLMEGFSK